MGDYVDSAGHCPSGRASGPAGLHIIKATVPRPSNGMYRPSHDVGPFTTGEKQARLHRQHRTKISRGGS